MRSCLICTSKIPATILIDGKRRNLCTRKYCLDCSPFNKHNTKRLDKYDLSTMEKNLVKCKCKRCGKEYLYQRNKGLTTHHCASCVVTLKKARVKQRAVDYKGGKCIICGYDRCNSSLVFHHVNPEEKDFIIAANYNRKWEILESELDKCVLLCHNCHNEYHSGFINIDFSASVA